MVEGGGGDKIKPRKAKGKREVWLDEKKIDSKREERKWRGRG